MDKNTLLQVWPIPAFDDNYIWCIHDGSNALVVDPEDAEPTLEYLKANKLTLNGIFTHHHADHTGGILPLLEKLGPKLLLALWSKKRMCL
jgi:hydroxyacylglutathione hydrolase